MEVLEKLRKRLVVTGKKQTIILTMWIAFIQVKKTSFYIDWLMTDVKLIPILHWFNDNRCRNPPISPHSTSVD